MLAPFMVGCSARTPVYEPPDAVSRCLHNAAIFAAGPSEVAGILGWLTGGATSTTRRNTQAMDLAEKTQSTEYNRLAASRSLGCSTQRNLGDRHFTCFGNYRARASCREGLYVRRPFAANCTGATRAWRNASLHVTYHWKSFMHSEVDVSMREEVKQAMQRDPARRAIVVLSSGLQHFTRFAEHRESLLHNVRDGLTWKRSNKSRPAL